MKELLSPVGNQEMLVQAIANGADAVYLSGKDFGARKYADNFTAQELKEAINYSHLYGVKVYVTVNTLIYEKEITELTKYLKYLYENHVDAVIMQDIGMIKLARSLYPQLEIHASTQCHTHNQSTINFLKNLGVSRVVLARELSIETIKNLTTDLELEVFVHGALCVCYSGCCLFSSLNSNRSGNRGECVGSCRLPYKLVENNKEVATEGDYLLSTKEVNTLPNLKQLLDSNITSFKIEGRMKSPAYVGLVTRLYRQYIDMYKQTKNITIDEVDMKNLSKLYNREFTPGYLFTNSSIMNLKAPNHQGITLGQVISLSKEKITLKLAESLSQNDGIRFKRANKGMIVNYLYNEKGLLVKKVNAQEICHLDNKLGIKEHDVILKTLDYELEQELKKLPNRQVPLDIKVTALLNQPLSIEFTDGVNTVSESSSLIESAQTNPTTDQDIISKLSKLGTTPYRLNNIEIIRDENIFLPLKNLNELRRQLVTKLNQKRLQRPPVVITDQIYNYQVPKDPKLSINCSVRNESQLQVCLANNLDTVYVTNYELYQKYKSFSQVYYRTNRVCHNYHEDVKNVLVTELGALTVYKNKNIISDYYLNVTNSKTLSYLEELGCKRVTLSLELTDDKIKDIDFSNHNPELIIYGTPELMITKYCPLKEVLHNCSNCKTNPNKYYLKDKNNHLYPLVKDDEKCLTHIMHYQKLNKINNLNYYLSIGINNFRIELFDETQEEIEEIIRKIKGVK